jgi:hypothetical protein
MTPIVLSIFSIAFIACGVFLYRIEQKKLPILRFEHISDDTDYSSTDLNLSSINQSSSDTFSEKTKLLISLSFVLIASVISFSLGASANKIIGISIASFGVSVIAIGQYLKIKKENQNRLIAQMIPLVMERLVMAVEAGLDIIPAIKSVIEIDKLAQSKQKKITIDPIVQALSSVIEIAERGASFEDSLKLVAKKYDNHALTHAFVHLGIAFKEGGEVIGPLRELSDATQSYYQETIEEDLAKLPVKATAPLVVTFAGLILFFLSSPLVQIISFAAKAVPGK